MGRSKVLFAVLFLFLTVSVVNAYTVVMLDGRRVEIPNEFAVTNSRLTYDVGNGIQIAIHLNTVDIGATERANGEAQGSFLRKTTAPQVPVEVPWAYPIRGAFGPFDNFGFGITTGPFGRFGHFRSSPFDGFLATPITPFPRVPFTGRRNIFTPRVNISPRPVHRGHGSRR